MKCSIYGNKMLAADLILVSLWGLFFCRYSTPGLLVLVPVRIALSFEMYRKSPWTFVSAVGFLIAFSSSGCISKPLESMFYYFFCAIGQSDLMVSIFNYPLEWEMKVWLAAVSILWYLWLAILPFVQGLLLQNLKEIQWKKKWIWLYLLSLSCVCVWIMFNEGEVGGILWGFGIAFLPIIYWCILDREGRSPIQLILDDRRIMWYLGYSVFMLAAFIIGQRDIYSLKLLGLLLLPPTFYVMLSRSFHLGTALTRCCLALSLAGYLYWLTFDAEKWITVALLALAIALIVYVGITITMKTHRWGVSLVLVAVVPIVIIPAVLGLNPYVCIDTDHTRLFIGNPAVRNGVYVVEKTVDVPEEGTPYWANTTYGLRDRYGMILPPKYTNLNVLGYYGRYVIVNKPVGKGCLISDQRLGVFDLLKREFVVDSNDLEVAEIKRIDDLTYKLIDPNGKYFATLRLLGDYNGKYYHDAHIEPPVEE